MVELVILTGAGVSAESGIRTFRDADGLWEQHPIEDVATPEAFDRNPALVHRFYNARRAQLLSPEVAPNAAHLALARLCRAMPERMLLVTQNIDDLHERAGSQQLLHMHGELRRLRCAACDVVEIFDGESDTQTRCSACGTAGRMRPHVVWFGEMPLYMERIQHALQHCRQFVSIGTSGTVYPAAGFVELALRAGARTLEINLEPSRQQSQFDERRYGPASVEVPRWVDEWLAG